MQRPDIFMEKQIRHPAHRNTRELEEAIARYLEVTHKNQRPSSGPPPPIKSSKSPSRSRGDFLTEEIEPRSNSKLSRT